MFQIKKPKSFFNLKTFSFFVAALFLGLISDSIFGRYIFRYQITETFTRAEAEAMLNRRITTTCFKDPVRGTVTSHIRHDDGQISVEITLDELFAGKLDKFVFGKETFRECIAEANEEQ